jgi:probable rRNA maturation factor
LSPISFTAPPGYRAVAVPLRAIVLSTLTLEGRKAGEIGVRLTGDPELRELNRQWRGIDRATDVLSFGYDDPPGERVSGDLVVSLDRMAEQARRYRVSRGRELARLVVHGALHLSGHDHHREGERARMRAAEAKGMRAAAPFVAALDRALGRLPPAG